MRKICPGFTLIELLVSISIVGLLLGIGVPYYTQFNRRQVVLQAAKTLKNDLRLAQSKALAGFKDTTVCTQDSDQLDGWMLKIETTSTYSIYGSCAAKIFGSKTVNLPGNVLVQSPSAPTVIQFMPLVKGVSSDFTIVLAGFSGSITQSVTITASGDIN